MLFNHFSFFIFLQPELIMGLDGLENGQIQGEFSSLATISLFLSLLSLAFFSVMDFLILFVIQTIFQV